MIGCQAKNKEIKMGLKDIKRMAKSGKYQDMAQQVTDLLAWVDSLKKLEVGETDNFENGNMSYEIVRTK